MVLAAVTMASASGRTEQHGLAEQLRHMQPPIGLSRLRFEHLLVSFASDPVFAKARAMGLLGSRMHHQYGWKPLPGSDLDIGLHIPAAHLTGVDARTLATPMARALDRLVNSENIGGSRGPGPPVEDRIEVSVTPFTLATTLSACPEFGQHLPLAVERRLFTEVASLPRRTQQQARYLADKLAAEKRHAPPGIYPEPSWYDRQAIVAIRPSPSEFGRMLDEIDVQRLAELGYRNVILLPPPTE